MENTWTFYIGPIAFDGTILSMTVLTVLIVFLLVFWASRKMQLKPTGKQNVLEYVVDFVSGINKDSLGAAEAPRFALFTFSLFGFVLIANELGLVTKISTTSDLSLWKSPTANPVITLTLASLVIILSNLVGAQKFGLKGYIKNSFLKPPAFMLPMNLFEEFTNTLSLGLRLYGNIFAGEVMLGLLASMAASNWIMLPIAIPLEMAWTAFSLFIGAIQAYVFVLLTTVYLSDKVLTEE